MNILVLLGGLESEIQNFEFFLFFLKKNVYHCLKDNQVTLRTGVGYKYWMFTGCLETNFYSAFIFKMSVEQINRI